MEYKHSDITEQIIHAFYEVYNTLGYGFLEKIYRRALAMEIQELGLKNVEEAHIHVYYDGEIIGEYFADLLVADAVIIELKAVKKLVEDHEAQLLNYLKATHYEVGLLLNFGIQPEIKRKAFDNARKGSLSWAASKSSKSKINQENLRSSASKK